MYLFKLSELRIGNILEYEGRPVYITSLSMDIDDEYEDTISFCYVGTSTKEMGGWNRSLVNKLKPIPLTPELLEKCGFVWETDKMRHLQKTLPEQGINHRQLSFFYDDGVCQMLQLYMSDYWDGYFEIKAPEYLHQLQNLYYNLTGEELDINL